MAGELSLFIPVLPPPFAIGLRGRKFEASPVGVEGFELGEEGGALGACATRFAGAQDQPEADEEECGDGEECEHVYILAMIRRNAIVHANIFFCCCDCRFGVSKR